MAGHGELILRQRVCLGSECRAVFYLCPRCDRGQRYCSHVCRNQARLHQHRRANHRYQNSQEAREDHRERQREYRQRRTQARVTDQSSLSISFRASSECGKVEATVIDAPPRFSDTGLPHWPVKRSGVWLCCGVCGRTGRLVNPFPPSPKRR
jgi:hypothetical protein